MSTLDSDIFSESPQEGAKLGAKVRVAMDSFEVVAADDLQPGDIIRLARLPAGARIIFITFWNDDLATTALTLDLGIYNTDGTARDIDGFASALDFAVEDITDAGRSVRFEAGAAGGYSNIDTMSQTLWELVGDVDNRRGQYDLCLTINASDTPSDGTISFVVLYTL